MYLLFILYYKKSKLKQSFRERIFYFLAMGSVHKRRQFEFCLKLIQIRANF